VGVNSFSDGRLPFELTTFSDCLVPTSVVLSRLLDIAKEVSFIRIDRGVVVEVEDKGRSRERLLFPLIAVLL
jgi:hypothetical protein